MKKQIAKDLLSIEAVFLSPNQPFTWASGIKSPIYCDNRLTLSDVKVRNDIKKALAKLVTKNFPDCEMLMGTATAGIAPAALVADYLQMPMGYVRANAKDHGRAKQIEGNCPVKTKVVVIEDLISTAGSVIEICNILKENDIEVLGIVSIFTYGMEKGLEKLKAANLINYSASNLDTLVKVAVKQKQITKEEKDKIISFRNNPSDESWLN